MTTLPPVDSEVVHEHAQETSMRIRARGRSFLALVLSPEAPILLWIKGLDRQISVSEAYFRGRPVILDLSLVSEQTPDLVGLQAALIERGIQIIGIEGASPSWAALHGWSWPEALEGGRAGGTVAFDSADPEKTTTLEAPESANETLYVEHAIRSGQTIMNLEGDVVVLGSVASGAEILAGGSIHVYGTLRGRAIAGVGNRPHSRIFARRLQAELLAIDGYYLVAEEIDAAFQDKSVQTQLIEARIIVSLVE